MRKRIVSIIILALFSLSVISCSNLTLSPEESKKIISASFKNGGLVESQDRIEVKDATAISGLIQGGYLVHPEK